MSQPLKLLIIAGARPNFMKVAPLIRAIRHRSADASPAFEYRLVHTGQHYDAKMSDVFFRELDIPAPDYNLEAGSGSHAVQTAQVMLKFEPVLVAEKPDWVVVVGDVNSTLACTLVAAKLGVKVAHVEAGLRSFDRSMPEEINRLATDAIADLLLTPSADANENLRREGVPETKIKLVGNIMIDSLIDNLPKARDSRILSTLGVESAQFVYVTLHRPANVDTPEMLLPIMEALLDLSTRLPVVFPIHPRTRKTLASFHFSTSRDRAMHIIEPVGYHDSLCLTENARLVLTDSGGLQEESTFFRTPCLTLRPNTERPVTLTIGSNRLTGITRLPADCRALLTMPTKIGSIPDYWDGQTACRILSALGSIRQVRLELPQQ